MNKREQEKTDLDKRLATIEFRLWKLENPPKFKVGDRVKCEIQTGVYTGDVINVSTSQIGLGYTPVDYWVYEIWDSLQQHRIKFNDWPVDELEESAKLPRWIKLESESND